MIGQRVLLLLVGICGLEIPLSLALNLTITPEFAHIPPNTDINVMCKADVPLTRCQFRALDKRIFDLSDGYFAPYDKEASYYGKGLENGECGVTFTGAELQWAVYVVGCRVRSETSDWVYAEMTLVKKSKPGLEVTISPSRRVVVLPGEQIQLLVDAKKPLIICEFVLTTASANVRDDFRFKFYNDSTLGTGKKIGTGMDYYGTGLSNGQCGLQIQNATENHNNGAFIDVHLEDEHEETLFFRIIVAKLPHTPAFTHNLTTLSDGSVELNAWCAVKSRPASNVTWYLGTERIPEKYLQHLYTDEWMWPSMIQTVKHKLTMKLDSKDDGKAFWCEAEHVSLQEPKKSRTVNIKMPICNNEAHRSTTASRPKLTSMKTIAFNLDGISHVEVNVQVDSSTCDADVIIYDDEGLKKEPMNPLHKSTDDVPIKLNVPVHINLTEDASIPVPDPTGNTNTSGSSKSRCSCPSVTAATAKIISLVEAKLQLTKLQIDVVQAQEDRKKISDAEESKLRMDILETELEIKKAILEREGSTRDSNLM